MPALVRWVLAAVIVLLIAGVPFALYRAEYAHAKRFREVTPGRFYRSGRLTAIYRMEYEGWSLGEAMRELRANGYGFVMSGEQDDFVIQFIQNYKPRTPAQRAAARAKAAAARAAAGGGS